MNNIQRAFLPRRSLQRWGGVELFFIWEPAEEVAGDYFFTNRGDNTINIELGDVMGHGVDAALSMTALNGVFFGLRESVLLPPRQMVSAANKFICKLVPTDAIVTSSIFVAHIDVTSGNVTYTNAGHPYPLYFSASEDDDEPLVLELITGGPLLGFSEEMTFESGVLRARPNDFIVMFTDGFTEAANPEGQEFGKVNDIRDILKSCAAMSAQEVVEHLKARLDHFRQGVPLSDDLTLVCLKFTEKFRPEEISR
jgi:sigma-B regulation protein RsbU (phosphoserine phosphatase)